MNIAPMGATGLVGIAVLAELQSGNHQVTALVRNPSKVAANDSLIAQALDMKDVVATVQGGGAAPRSRAVWRRPAYAGCWSFAVRPACSSRRADG